VHQLLEALRGDGIAEQGNRPLGLIQAYPSAIGRLVE
jgi:hypothetical protein